MYERKLRSEAVSKRASLYLFLLGTFSMTQVHVIGNIGISELVVFIIAPFIFMQDYSLLRRDGFLPIVWLSILTCIGCVVASVENNIPFALFLRGLAAPYAIFGVLVVGHRLVRQSMNGYKWLCVGLALTWIINIFIFQRAVEADAWGGGARGLDAVEGIMSGPLFWISRINHLIQIPISGWYLQTPLSYSVWAPLFMFFFSALTSASGRSTAAAAFGSVVLVLLGGKSRKKMRSVSRHFVLLLVVGFILSEMLTALYKITATKGLLGEKAQEKYEMQVGGKSKGIISVLMGGRLEFFYGLYAASKKPLIGYGPWAQDLNDTYGDFLLQYGDVEDLQRHIGFMAWSKANGDIGGRFVGAHSHIIGFWLKFGILGFLFWIYVLNQLVRYFIKDLSTVPQWYGMLAVATPSFVWNVFFSPFGDRVGITMFLVFVMMTRAIRTGAVQMPLDMFDEANRAI